MPSWPETLPAFPLAETFRETLPDTALRSPMEQGPAKVRQRTSAGAAQIAAAYVLTPAQAETLEDFYRDTLAGGTLAFGFTHPRKEEVVSCRFKRPPEYTGLNGGRFRAVIELEVLP